MTCWCGWREPLHHVQTRRKDRVFPAAAPLDTEPRKPYAAKVDRPHVGHDVILVQISDIHVLQNGLGLEGTTKPPGRFTSERFSFGPRIGSDSNAKMPWCREPEPP